MNLHDPTLNAARVIAALGLAPHREGGHYREMWRDKPADGARGAGTAIHFLLDAPERSHWHRVDAAECWHWQAGGPLVLSLSEHGTRVDREIVLGPELGTHALLGVVPKGWWQAARPAGGRWCLVSCTVSRAFDYTGFELAPPGWEPRA